MSYDPLPLMRAKSFLIETPTTYQSEYVRDRDFLNEPKCRLTFLIRSAGTNEFVGCHYAFASPFLWVLVSQLDAAAHKVDPIWYGDAFFPTIGYKSAQYVKAVSNAEIAMIVRECHTLQWQFP
ncbi:MAG: hypothetical protein P0Y56_13210 [Candidatus Andeanibacterium colombiense]|uniref:Uncharacterized protein n=1 Tax=Candidatus Andeanibacterium colombiense TaxID=3121345 RepID=A0AAJ5X8E3_9SPHN|nr:MAG: hypothetical protein P0Y56_13210 [Sphingomonadaceae bacterium]